MPQPINDPPEDPSGDDLFLPFLIRALTGDGDESADEPAETLEWAQTIVAPGAAAAPGRGAELVARLEEQRVIARRYRELGTIGAGGMGVVHEVFDTHLGRRLAMKVVRAPQGDEAFESERRDRFLEEAQITGQLDHPSIVPVHELGMDTEGRLYFTMPLVRGRTLGTILTQREREPEVAREWSRVRLLEVVGRVCEAVAYAQAKGVLHRDLKPDNIMVGRFNEVYVMDWGLAKLQGEAADVAAEARLDEPLAREETIWTARFVDRRASSEAVMPTVDGSVLGTPAYMPPEQARGRIASLDERSDIYSLGAMLYHVLAGHAPYVERDLQSPYAILLAVIEGPPTALARLDPALPPELVAVCEKAMARAPQDRYQTAMQLESDLRAYREGRVVSAHRTGAIAELVKWIGRNRLFALASALLMLSVLTGLIVATSLYLETKRGEQKLQRSAITMNQVRVSDLIGESASLWPALPERIPELESWLSRARTASEEISQLSLDLREQELSAVERQNLALLSEQVRRLDAADDGLIEGRASGPQESVGARLEDARKLAVESVESQHARSAWTRARAEVAADPRYSGLQLSIQVGLLPLGPDPDSSLQEFAHLLSGRAPERDALTGELAIDEQSSIVLVLIPGGRAIVGSSSQPGSEHYVPDLPQAMAFAEGPVHSLELDAFFLSKYELSQSQWLRLSGENPSFNSPGTVYDQRTITALHPVESVTWDDAVHILAQSALVLPSEWQWEYAARAGSSTPWWTGAERESLRGRVNLADESAARAGFDWPAIGDWPGLDDGWATHAPIDSLAKNPFGLFHILGNVHEWCRDLYVSRSGPEHGRDGDTLRLAKRVFRGGSFDARALRARSAFRGSLPPDEYDSVIGLRPGRAVEP